MGNFPCSYEVKKWNHVLIAGSSHMMKQTFPIARGLTNTLMEADVISTRISTTVLAVYISSRWAKQSITTLQQMLLQQRYITAVNTCISRFNMPIASIGSEGRQTSAIPVCTSVHGVRWMERAIRRRYWNPSASKDTLSTTSGVTITKTLNTKTNMSVCLERCEALWCTKTPRIASYRGMVW